MDIKILGTGCPDRYALELRTREALAELGYPARITAVSDYPTIRRYRVSTPALVVNEQVVIAGRVPTTRQVVQVLAAAHVDE